MGETQERERVLAHFSQRYYECNPNAISSEGKKLHVSGECVSMHMCVSREPMCLSALNVLKLKLESRQRAYTYA